MIVIFSHGLVGSVISAEGDGKGYVMMYNPEAHDGMGSVEFTTDTDQALKFSTFGDAWDFVRQVPRNRPLRGDGRPNRPLTAFTLELMQEGETPL